MKYASLIRCKAPQAQPSFCSLRICRRDFATEPNQNSWSEKQSDNVNDPAVQNGNFLLSAVYPKQRPTTWVVVHIPSSHLLTSSHLHIFTSSHLLTSAHIFTSSHIFSSLHFFSCSHLLSSSHLHIFSSSRIFSHLLTSSHIF